MPKCQAQAARSASAMASAVASSASMMGGMPVAVIARGDEHVVTVEGRVRRRGPLGQHGLQLIAGGLRPRRGVRPMRRDDP